MFCTDNHFIVKLTDYFQDKANLYMVLEFVNGGEMFTHIQKQKRRRFAEPQVGPHRDLWHPPLACFAVRLMRHYEARGA